MSKKNRERAVVCNRVKDAGLLHPRLAAELSGESLTTVADTLLKVKDAMEKYLGGKPRYTGNTRAYSNGAVAHEVRCAKCEMCFWQTGLPTPFCVDCRK